MKIQEIRLNSTCWVARIYDLGWVPTPHTELASRVQVLQDLLVCGNELAQHLRQEIGQSYQTDTLGRIEHHG